LFYKINRNPYYLAFDDGVKQTNLRKDDVLGCKLSIPKVEPEQSAIATILSDMDTEIESLEQKRNKYTMLKQGVMQQLLTGRIRMYANN
jgi:type I restriction enzyme S subunit